MTNGCSRLIEAGSDIQKCFEKLPIYCFGRRTLHLLPFGIRFGFNPQPRLPKPRFGSLGRRQKGRICYLLPERLLTDFRLTLLLILILIEIHLNPKIRRKLRLQIKGILKPGPPQTYILFLLLHNLTDEASRKWDGGLLERDRLRGGFEVRPD